MTSSYSIMDLEQEFQHYRELTPCSDHRLGFQHIIHIPSSLEVQILVGARIFLSKTSRLTLEPAQPPIQVALPELMRLGSEVNHSPSSNAEAKNEWSYTSTSPIRFHGVDGKTLSFFTCFNFQNFHILSTLCICVTYDSYSKLLLLSNGH